MSEKKKRTLVRKKQSVDTSKPLPTNRLWNIEEVAYYLNETVAEIYKRVERRTLPGASKLGRTLRFDPAKIEKWKLQQQVATLEELTK